MAFHFSFHRLVVVGIRHSGAWRIYMPHRLSSLITLFSTVTERPSNPCGVEFSGSYRRSHYDGAHEEYILNELADLLPISQYNAVSNLFKEDRVKNERGTKDPDVFLSPEEKLRGIFLQKLKGKAALDRALTNAGVDVNIDVVAGVVNRGNLGGEAMVSFFRWAIERPTISRDTNSYNVIIKALGRRKFFGFMEEMLYEMSSNSVTPSLETLSIVMDSFVRARQVNRAIGVFRNMEEFGWKCVTDSLNVLLQTLCQRFHVGVANSLLNSVKGKIPFNLRTYNIIIGGWSNIGRVGDIERILEAMVADGFAPDCLTFAYVIEGLGRAGQIEDAVKIFDGMKEKGCEPDVGVYNAMLSNFAVVGDFDTCMNYYRSMLSKRCDPNIDTYRSLINFFLKFRKVADALEMFDEMLSRGFVPTTGMITSFIEPLCRYGPPYAAMMIYKKARKAGCLISLSAYKLLLVRLSRFGKCGMLLTLWDEMQEAGHSSDVEVYECIVNGLCNIGQLENAVLVMEESLRKGFCPCRRIYSKLNSKLLASNNNVEKAYKLFLKIKDARLQENARRYWRSNGWHF